MGKLVVLFQQLLYLLESLQMYEAKDSHVKLRLEFLIVLRFLLAFVLRMVVKPPQLYVSFLLNNSLYELILLDELHLLQLPMELFHQYIYLYEKQISKSLIMQLRIAFLPSLLLLLQSSLLKLLLIHDRSLKLEQNKLELFHQNIY